MKFYANLHVVWCDHYIVDTVMVISNLAVSLDYVQSLKESSKRHDGAVLCW